MSLYSQRKLEVPLAQSVCAAGWFGWVWTGRSVSLRNRLYLLVDSSFDIIELPAVPVLYLLIVFNVHAVPAVPESLLFYTVSAVIFWPREPLLFFRSSRGLPFLCSISQ